MTFILLFSLLACDRGADKVSESEQSDSPGPDDSAVEADDSEGVGDDSAPPEDPDADTDGFPASADCDDAAADVNPDAAEICDGRDQDCDGVADDGVPGDGAGCQEPPAPTWDDAVGILHITTRTGADTNNGTDDRVTFCLSDTECHVFDNADWNDNDMAQTDVFVAEDLALSKASLDQLTVTVTDGADQWVPECFAVSLDGEPVYCHDDLGLKMGSETGETPSWTDPDGLVASCLGCFEAPITHGPIVGATTDASVQIWVRTDATRRVALRVSERADALADAAPVHVGYPAAEDDFGLALGVVGLSAGTVYWYDLEVEGTRYGPWSFTTARASDDRGELRFAFGSCARDEDQPIWDSIRAYSPDLFLFVGDNHYANSSDLGTLRTYYRHAHAVDQRAELMMETPILATWDDHDYVGNNTDGSEPGRDTALRAFEEYWANGDYGTDEVPGVFSAHTWGDLQFVLLDDRYYRGLEDSILGDAQEQWLYDELLGTDARFRFLISGSQWTTQGSDDSWGVYPEAQARLLQYIADNDIGGVVLLSGDVHRSEFRLLPGAEGGYDLPELTSSPLATTPSPCQHESEERDCFDSDNAFVLVDVDTAVADPTITARILDEDGGEQATWTFTLSELQ